MKRPVEAKKDEKSRGSSVRMGKNNRKTKKNKENNKPRNKPIGDLIQKSLREFKKAKEENLKAKNERDLKNLEISDRLAQKNIDVRRRNKERFNAGGKSPQKIFKNMKKIVENQVFCIFFSYLPCKDSRKKKKKRRFQRKTDERLLVLIFWLKETPLK